MLWIIAPLVVAVIAFAAGYRKTALGFVIAAGVAAVAIYGLVERTQQRAESRITVSEISLGNVAVRHTFDASYEITGKVKNGSATYQLDGIALKVKLRDCIPGDASQCEAQGHATVTVPPGESRDFRATLYFGKGHRPAKGALAWDYEIEAVTARRQ
jgi:hypothetical protein